MQDRQLLQVSALTLKSRLKNSMTDYEIVGITDIPDFLFSMKSVYAQTGDDEFLARLGKSLNLQQTYGDTFRFTARSGIDVDALSEQLKEKGLVLSLVG
jgi:hypothetical protein